MKNKTNYHIRKNIKELFPYSCARNDHSSDKGIFLDANENPYGTYNRYPDPLQTDLKRKISEMKNCRPDQIFIGNGSDEIIDLALRIFCEPYQDKALAFTPTYGMYEVAACINAIPFIKVPLNDQFQINMDRLLPLLSDEQIKLIFICSPNNPTGNLIKEADIEFILTNFRGMVMIDEAYIDFSDRDSFIRKLDVYPNLIVLQTLSKAWGSAGLRLGIAYMNEKVQHWFSKVKPPYNISTPNQQKALEVLNKVSAFTKNLKYILEERSRLLKELEQLDIIRNVYATHANFILVEVEDADELYEKLIKDGIVVRNRNTIIKNCLRITVGTTKENQMLINRLKQETHG